MLPSSEILAINSNTRPSGLRNEGLPRGNQKIVSRLTCGDPLLVRAKSYGPAWYGFMVVDLERARPVISVSYVCPPHQPRYKHTSSIQPARTRQSPPRHYLHLFQVLPQSCPLPKNKVIIASSYRLNIFGFPSTPALPPTSANLGLRDQRLALEWLRNNIASFGGDPKRMTIFGQSAGGTSLAVHSFWHPHDLSYKP
jgi:Carboxylesterase family